VKELWNPRATSFYFARESLKKIVGVVMKLIDGWFCRPEDLEDLRGLSAKSRRGAVLHNMRQVVGESGRRSEARAR